MAKYKYEFTKAPDAKLDPSHPVARWLTQWAERWKIGIYSFAELTLMLSIYDLCATGPVAKKPAKRRTVKCKPGRARKVKS